MAFPVIIRAFALAAPLALTACGSTGFAKLGEAVDGFGQDIKKLATGDDSGAVPTSPVPATVVTDTRRAAVPAGAATGPNAELQAKLNYLTQNPKDFGLRGGVYFDLSKCSGGAVAGTGVTPTDAAVRKGEADARRVLRQWGGQAAERIGGGLGGNTGREMAGRGAQGLFDSTDYLSNTSKALCGRAGTLNVQFNQIQVQYSEPVRSDRLNALVQREGVGFMREVEAQELVASRQRGRTGAAVQEAFGRGVTSGVSSPVPKLFGQ